MSVPTEKKKYMEKPTIKEKKAFFWQLGEGEEKTKRPNYNTQIILYKKKKKKK